MLNNFFSFFENHAVYEIMLEKYSWVGKATDDNMTRAHCVVDN
jgi:hypothetical protein